MNPLQAAILREMGIAPLWRLRSAVSGESDPALPSSTVGEEPARGLVAKALPDASAKSAPTLAVAAAEPANQPPSHQPPRSPRVVAPESAGKIQRERIPASVVPVAVIAAGASPAGVDAHRVERISTLGWSELNEEIRHCTACPLCEKRKQAVPGVGDHGARWMLVGEGPGAEEDQRGEPFVGQAGKLLDSMLAAVGLHREEGVFIANAVKCRPPHNRTPEAGEIAACRPFLERQIALVQPRLLIALGRPAALSLLNTEVSIAAARGKRFDLRGTPVVVTYHPAYLLRNPQDKGKAWEDLCLARRMVPPA